jgi:hypothetical protein
VYSTSLFLDPRIEVTRLKHCITLGHSQVLGWNERQEKLDWPKEPIGVSHGKLDESETLGNSPSKESLDKWTISSGRSSFTEWRWGGWTRNILEGWNNKLVVVAIKATVRLNALYHPLGRTQWWLSLSQNLSYRMDLSTSPNSNNTSSLM